MAEPRFQKRTLFLVLYLVFAILPVYWMVNMSLKTNEEWDPLESTCRHASLSIL